MRLRLVTPPASEPLTLAEAKEYLRVTHSHEDNAITNLVAGARKWAENGCRRSFITQAWEVSFEVPKVSGFHLLADSQRIEDPDEILPYAKLPRGPVASVTEVSVFNEDTGAGVVLDPTEYALQGNHFFWSKESLSNHRNNHRLVIKYATGDSLENFKAGYPDLVTCTSILLGALYENRGFASQQMPIEAQNIIGRYWTPL